MKRFLSLFSLLLFSYFANSVYCADSSIPHESIETDSIMDDSIENLTGFEAIVESLGGISTDYSYSKKIKLDEPALGYLNITGIDDMPVRKNQNLKAWMEYFDPQGNYFKKRIILDLQGNSSTIFPKKNAKLDICEDEWIGDATTDVTFGNWVKQDSFHLKAFYNDYFRGLGEVAYNLFEQVIADREGFAYPWQRSEYAENEEKALCHPMAFPVIVYLNNEFYGVFALQLKKHRKNMAHGKTTPEHIHLDGTIDEATLFNGKINWSAFEIRNPKSLICVDGSKYDGDRPKELIDENSEMFDSADENHLRSATVKAYIINLTNYCAILKEMQSAGASDKAIREKISEMFDVEGYLDYNTFSAVINNIDGYDKNWQWFTYNGVKWHVAPYDLDMSFGNMYYAYFLLDPEYIYPNEKPGMKFIINMGPTRYLNRYFSTEINERYCKLRRSGIFSTSNIMSLICNWYDRISPENYDLEYVKWSDSYCIKDMVVDPNWEVVEPCWMELRYAQEYNPSKTYLPGNICQRYWKVFRALNEVNGINPCPVPGYRDDLNRVEDWITRRLVAQDQWFEFDAVAPDDEVLTSVEDVYSTDSLNSEIGVYYDLLGRKLNTPVKGINIVRDTKGNFKKILSIQQ